MTYIDVPIVTDPDDLAAQAFDQLQGAIPGWVPNDGNLETILTEALALIASVVAFKASGEPRSIFRWFGPLVGITPIDATQATVQSTWTARDTQGYTIAAGTVVGIRTAGDELVAFTVLNGVDILPGEGATDAGAVTLIAVNAGSAGSGLGTIGGAVELIDPLDWVAGVVQTDVTTGGVDAETDQAFLDRLRGELQLLTPRPILAPDFAALARTVAGVYRSVAIDGYNPGDDTFGNPRMVSVACMDANGNAIDSTHKTAVEDYLEGLREVNFEVNAMDPTFTQIDVIYRVAAAAGFDPAALVTAVTAAITVWLAPASWGLPATGDRAAWIDSDTVRYLDLSYVIRRVPGVDHITELAFNAHAAAVGTFTVTIASPGVFALTAHGLTAGDQVFLETTGALPTGLEPDVVYYVHDVVDADHFKLTATHGGAAIDTSGSQSGTHSLFRTGTDDVVMAGPASLPRPNQIRGSHT
jgi:uncharacterized phage protein gp47/JayE